MNMRSHSSNQVDSWCGTRTVLMAGLALLVVASAAFAQAPPSTDLYLMGVDSSGASPQLGLPVNITAREGYDNQPAFTLDGKRVLYTSMRGEQTDIFSYELVSAETRQVTDTLVSEYSPTPMAGGTAFSAIRQDLEGKQFLYHYPLGEGKATLLLPEVEPVGYHGWSGDKLLLFVLHRPSRQGRIENPSRQPWPLLPPGPRIERGRLCDQRRRGGTVDDRGGRSGFRGSSLPRHHATPARRLRLRPWRGDLDGGWFQALSP